MQPTSQTPAPRTYTVYLSGGGNLVIGNMTGDRAASAVGESVLVIERVVQTEGGRVAVEAHSFPLRTVKYWRFTTDDEPAAYEVKRSSAV